MINLKFKSVLRNQTEQVPGDLERAAPPPIASLPEFFTLVLFVLFCSPNFFFRPNHEPLPRLRDRHLRFNTSEQLDSVLFQWVEMIVSLSNIFSIIFIFEILYA